MNNIKKNYNAESQDLIDLQEDLFNVLAPLTKNPLLDGVLLEDISISTTATAFPHKLGRKWRGAILTKLSANVTVWYPTALQDETKFITIDASGSATASFWIF